MLWLATQSILLTTARAQSQGASIEESFIAFFNKTCMQNMPQLDPIRATARQFDWKPVARNEAEMLAPPDPRTPFEGWAVSHDGRNTIISLSEGIVGSTKVVICTTMERNLDQDALVGIIEATTKARAAHDDIHDLERHRGWFAAKNGQMEALQLKTSARDRFSTAILSVVARTPE